MRFYSGCKINLGLKITGVRNDGYHLLKSLFFPLAYPRDILEIKKTRDASLVLETELNYAKDNILEKTWHKFQEASGKKIGARVCLQKNIPAGAGLGGGSGNAALFLAWLNSACANPLDTRQLVSAAAQIGADVPFFLFRQPARISGIGEELCFLARWPAFHVALIWPEIHLSTKDVFLQFERRKNLRNTANLTKPEHMDKKKCVSTKEKFFCNLENDLEQSAIELCPQLREVAINLTACGADHVAMSGSGSAFYGIFTSENKARLAARALRKIYRFVYISSIKGKLPHKQGMERLIK